MKKIILDFILKYKYTIIGCIIYYIFAYILKAGFINSFANVLLLFLTFNTIAKLAIQNKTCKILAFIILIILSIIIVFDIFFFIQFKTTIPISIFASILETNTQEVFSMMKEYWLISLIILTPTIILNILIIKELEKSKLKGKLSLIMIPLIIILVFTTAYFRFDNRLKNEKKLIQHVLKNDFLLGTYHFFGASLPLFYHDIFTGIIYINEMKDIKMFSLKNKPLYKGVSKTAKNESVEKIYLVIGESSFRDHYSLYGYSSLTTPFLDSLKAISDNSFIYYNAISPASVTREAFRLTLTFATPHNVTPFYKYKTIIDMANDIEYETVWISSQDTSDFFDNYISLIASGSTKRYYQVKDKDRFKNINDFNLITVLPEYHKNNKKQLIILHLIGSHISYSDKFDNSDLQITNEDKVIQEYDRSIHHTDQFLKKLYNYTKSNDKKSIIYYFSDHGEIIGGGHGFPGGAEQYKIPLLAINNNTDIPLKEVMNKYVNEQTNCINSLATINIIAEMIGYNIDSTLVEKTKQEGAYIYNMFNYEKASLFKDIPPF